MDEPTMRRLWEFNQSVPRVPLAQTSRAARTQDETNADIEAQHPEQLEAAPQQPRWAGYRVRTMLHCLYTISMLCLLRYDEALNIRWEDITFGYDANGIQFIQLNLLFRKTHQNGSESLCDVTTTSSEIVSYRHRTVFSISRPHEAMDVRSHGDC